MKPRAIIALSLLTLATTSGCMLEVEAEGAEPSGWAQQPLTVGDDPAALDLDEDTPSAHGQLPVDALPTDTEEWTAQNEGASPDDLAHIALLPEGDPAPDPWRSAPQDDSDPADE